MDVNNTHLFNATIGSIEHRSHRDCAGDWQANHMSITSDFNETNYLFQRSNAIQRKFHFILFFHTSKTANSTIKTIFNLTILSLWLCAKRRIIIIIIINNNNIFSHIHPCVAVETLGPINEAGDSFLAQVGKLLSSKSDDSREIFFLFQRISVIIQRFNEIAFRGTFIEESCHDE